MTAAGSYQIGILGRPDGKDNTLVDNLHGQLEELGVDRSALTIPLARYIRLTTGSGMMVIRICRSGSNLPLKPLVDNVLGEAA